MKFDRQNYLYLRPFILSGQFNEGVIQYLSWWCEQEKRPFNILMSALQWANEHGMVGEWLGKLVVYLDKKNEIVKLYNREGDVIKVY